LSLTLRNEGFSFGVIFSTTGKKKTKGKIKTVYHYRQLS
jgi:hypothetical protein